MSLDLVSAIWEAVRSHMDSGERKEAADDMVNILIDNDFDAVTIKEAFRGDRDVSKALSFYAEQHSEDDEFDDIDDDDTDDEWN
jgi:hypothetical protein